MVNIYLFTATFRIFNDVQNELRPKSTEDGCHNLSPVAFEEGSNNMARNPSRERNEHVFFFFDNFKLLLFQKFDRPNTTPFGQDSITLTFKALL